MTDYNELNSQLEALIEGVIYKTANLANASALIFHSLKDINWAGFYLIEDGKLVLNAFQGKNACIEIGIGKGVCGTAVARDETVVVADVHKFPGHIACDSTSNSEIVIPLRSKDGVIGVLDIDSPVFNRFSNNDRNGLEKLAHTIEKHIFGV